MRPLSLICIVSITLLACEEDPNKKFCSFNYQITITNETELTVKECSFIQNNNPSCDVNYNIISCDISQDNFEYTFLDIEPLSTIELTGIANYNCDGEYLNGGYGIFEINEILNPNIEFISSIEVPPPTYEQIAIASRSHPRIQLTPQYKSFEFDLEVDNQTDSTAHINYETLNESCQHSDIKWIDIEPNSSLSITLSTANLGGKCPLRWGVYNFRIFLIRNGTWPIEVYEIVKQKQTLKYTVTLDSLTNPNYLVIIGIE